MDKLDFGGSLSYRLNVVSCLVCSLMVMAQHCSCLLAMLALQLALLCFGDGTLAACNAIVSHVKPGHKSIILEGGFIRKSSRKLRLSLYAEVNVTASLVLRSIDNMIVTLPQTSELQLHPGTNYLDALLYCRNPIEEDAEHSVRVSITFQGSCGSFFFTVKRLCQNSSSEISRASIFGAIIVSLLLAVLLLVLALSCLRWRHFGSLRMELQPATPRSCQAIESTCSGMFSMASHQFTSYAACTYGTVTYGNDQPLLQQAELAGVVRENKQTWSRQFSHLIVDSSHVDVDRIVSEGLFVCVGVGVLKKYMGGDEPGEPRPVAVKHLKSLCSAEDIPIFLKELTLLEGIVAHTNVLRLLVICIDEGKPALACLDSPVEYNLKRYVRQRQLEDNPLSHYEMLTFCTQLAAGCCHLHQQSIVHKDIGSRNCWLTSDNVVKISCSTGSRDIFSEDYADWNRSCSLPLRWLSLESLLQGKYTHASDVWSFGVTIWEVSTQCSILPYYQQSDSDLLEFLNEGHRLRQPETCPDKIYDIMTTCWAQQPASRPKFPSLLTMLEGCVKVAEDAMCTTRKQASCGQLPEVSGHQLNSHLTSVKSTYCRQDMEMQARSSFPRSVSNPGDPDEIAKTYSSTPPDAILASQPGPHSSQNPLYVTTAFSTGGNSSCTGLSSTTPPYKNHSSFCVDPGMASVPKGIQTNPRSCGSGRYLTTAKTGPSRRGNTSLSFDNTASSSPSSLGIKYENALSLPGTPRSSLGHQQYTPRRNVSQDRHQGSLISSGTGRPARPTKPVAPQERRLVESYVSVPAPEVSPSDATSIRSCLRTPGSSLSSCRSSVHFAGDTFGGKMSNTAPGNVCEVIDDVAEGDEAVSPPPIPRRDEKPKPCGPSSVASGSKTMVSADRPEQMMANRSYRNMSVVGVRHTSSFSPSTDVAVLSNVISCLTSGITSDDEEYTVMDPAPREADREGRHIVRSGSRHGGKQSSHRRTPSEHRYTKQQPYPGGCVASPLIGGTNCAMKAPSAQSQNGQQERSRIVSNPVDIPAGKRR